MDTISQQNKTRLGFTLVELLVVIGIIAIVAAILFPVFASIRERGRRTVCQSNLRQIALAMQQYVQDNSSVYPLETVTRQSGGRTVAVYWAEAIFPYVKNEQVFICPDASSEAETSYPGAKSPSIIDYGFDLTRLNVFVPPYPTNNIQGTREAALATPSTIYVNVDAGWSDAEGKDHYSRVVPKTSCGRSFDGSTLHSDGGNYSFADGHVEWLTPEEAGEVKCKNGPPPAPFKG
jgi:prepilin-type N-terminal cleavage/methylation domain-containing protein/prepilin-type processing-associated H-X9-DG protein